MDYKLKKSYLKNKRLVKKYGAVIGAYTDDAGNVDLEYIIKNNEFSDKEIVKIFEITRAELRQLKNPCPNSFVWDVRQGWALEYIADPVGPIKYFEGKPVRACARLGDGSLVPIDRTKKLDTLPEKLYRAINWKSISKVLFALKTSLMDKLQMGGIAIMILIMLFFAYVLVNQ